MSHEPVFTRIVSTEAPSRLVADPATYSSPAFALSFVADGVIPFPQVILRSGGGERLFRGPDIVRGDGYRYTARIPEGMLDPGRHRIQVEGCRTDDLSKAGGADWVKAFHEIEIAMETRRASVEVRTATGGAAVKVFFGIHKHMHQPYYRATDASFWDDEKTMIFDQRAGCYSSFIPAAVRQYIDGGLSHAGLSTSWSGSLVEQLARCERDALCYGHYAGWANELREVAAATTALGNPRVDFTAFGFFHPLMPLVPHRNIVKQVRAHRAIVRDAFGVDASPVMFPPETAFHVRMIPALREAGVEAVIYDSIHRARSCKGYPYGGPNEGMLPPNPAEQRNPPVSDWIQLQHVWAASKISPSLLRPEYIRYDDPDGKTHTIVGVPAERYLGNEDARGGFGALRYPEALGQVYDAIARSGDYDPKHPPFFLLHSDGDNYGGGADSYYKHNTGQLVKWLQGDPRFELTTVRDYLAQFPPDPARAAHVEPGSWSGADNGDPQFMKWFSRYRDPYSPDLNSWAVLTALQNAVHTFEDAGGDTAALARAERLMLLAETSCYWYWTGQDVWDAQVTQAANAALDALGGSLDAIVAGGKDRTGPTIFPPWILPENPGGKTWGHGGLRDAEREGVVHCFIHDVSGIRAARLLLRRGGSEQALDMRDCGAYPCRTGARATSHLFTCALPAGAGDVSYVIDAEDGKGNRSRSSLERVFLA